jgi:hypothetical protein
MMAQTTTLFFVLQDADNDPSRVEIEIPSSTSATNALALVPVVGELIHDIVNGGLVKAGITIEVDTGVAFAGWGPVATLIADIQEKAEFSFRTVQGNLKKINLPTFLEDLFIPQTKEVDTSDPAIAAFVTAMEDGLTVNSTLVQFTDQRGEDLLYLEGAVENWGKARR